MNALATRFDAMYADIVAEHDRVIRKLTAANDLLAACKAALIVTHDPAVERLLMEAIAKAEEA
jgi:phosphohistidine phosphatase SixA